MQATKAIPIAIQAMATQIVMRFKGISIVNPSKIEDSIISYFQVVGQIETTCFPPATEED